MRIIVIVETSEGLLGGGGYVGVHKELHAASFEETESITEIINWANRFALVEGASLSVKLSLDGAVWGSTTVESRQRGRPRRRLRVPPRG